MGKILRDLENLCDEHPKEMEALALELERKSEEKVGSCRAVLSKLFGKVKEE